ncbi:hypothetical protein ACROYT_G010011 [Oculina patagonica]
MSNGQEVVKIDQEEIGEAGVTSKTLMAATDKGALPQPSPPKSPEALPVQPTGDAPTIPLPSHHVTVDVDDVRKKSCSDCLKDFCCLHDANYKWYSLKGKGLWFVLFLLLGYLIFGVLALAAAVVFGACAIACGLCNGGNVCSIWSEDN